MATRNMLALIPSMVPPRGSEAEYTQCHRFGWLPGAGDGVRWPIPASVITGGDRYVSVNSGDERVCVSGSKSCVKARTLSLDHKHIVSRCQARSRPTVGPYL